MKYPMDRDDPQIYETCNFNPSHPGIDIGTGYRTGLNIYAVEDGEVVVARTQRHGYGRHIKILHRYGISMYAHLSALMVEAGQIVKKGEVIGLSGGHPKDEYAGNSTGCHLHFEWLALVPQDPAPLWNE